MATRNLQKPMPMRPGGVAYGVEGDKGYEPEDEDQDGPCSSICRSSFLARPLRTTKRLPNRREIQKEITPSTKTPAYVSTNPQKVPKT